MDGASGARTPRRAAVLFRDGLIIALLALRPLRLRNLTDLTIGSDLLRAGKSWMIVLPPSATKTHETYEFGWPESLHESLEAYLGVHRPVLMARHGRWNCPVGDRLGVSTDGSPLKDMAIYLRFTRATRDAFGRSINPHLARHAAATTLAIHDPAHVRSAAPLLGHRGFATTQRYYNQAQSLEAHREYSATILALRK
jgi:integrase/recombinase XerD